MDKIEKVRDAASIKTIAPKLLDAVTVNGKKALLVALDLASELRVKKYWKIDGHVPQAWDEV
ncbi:MAG: hypothetical protein M0T74_17250, partial [Desulfitobacterium hafniense]|nr:hypothetical protein [Desulfitobacterium hafniense]